MDRRPRQTRTTHLASAALGCLVLWLSSGAVGQGDRATGTLEVRVTRVESANGKVGCSLFRTERGFPAKADRAFRSTWSAIEGSTATCRFESVPAGVYAVSAFHDQNDDGEFARSFIGRPKEPWGVSKNAKSRVFGPPRWEEAKFPFNPPRDRIAIRLHD
jgi:uncharacterized protein (DUF2141 family)